MTLSGTVQNGMILLDPTPALPPNGTRVRVEVDDPPAATLFDRLAGVVGKAAHLPDDAAARHDQHLYGTPGR